MPKSDAPQPPAAGAALVTEHGPLPEETARDVLKLVGAAAEADGVGPLSEHVMLHLRYGGEPGARNLLLVSDGQVAGYAHLDPAGPGEAPSGELVISPAHRRQGLGLLLTRALVAAAGGSPLRLWAHGDQPAAARLAAAAGFERVRALWQMRRSLRAPLEPPKLPDGVTTRTFAAGRDEDAWLALNARAFAQHPEQGAWTREDLDLREREAWFDPGGFFLAQRGGRLVGFHWTKVHGAADPAGSTAADAAACGEHGADRAGADAPIGEVYVVGVDPGERGSGLGRALTLVGLRYLRARGLPEVMLYVDESNTPAIRLYASLGFTRWHTDVMFSNGPAGGP